MRIANLMLSPARRPAITGGGPVLTDTLVNSGQGSSLASIPTGTITWAAGDMIIVALDLTYAGTEADFAISGGGLTWTARSNTNANTYRLKVWSAVAGSAGSGILTMAGDSADKWAYQVHVVSVTGGSLSIGTVQESGNVNAASLSLSVSAVDANDYQLVFTGIMNNVTSGTYAGLTASPRAGWDEKGENLVIQSGNNWGAFLHSQLSPIGGETTASISGLLATGTYRLIVIPLVVT